MFIGAWYAFIPVVGLSLDLISLLTVILKILTDWLTIVFLFPFYLLVSCMHDLFMLFIFFSFLHSLFYLYCTFFCSPCILCGTRRKCLVCSSMILTRSKDFTVAAGDIFPFAYEAVVLLKNWSPFKLYISQILITTLVNALSFVGIQELKAVKITQLGLVIKNSLFLA